MSPEELKTRSNAFVEEVFNRGKVLALDDLFTPDAVIHDPGLELRGTVAMRSGLRSLLAAFPDLHITVEDQIAEMMRLHSATAARAPTGVSGGASPPQASRSGTRVS